MARLMEISTPLGHDVLLFRGMHAREELSRLSEYQIDLLSTRGDIRLDDILGQNVTVSLGLPDNTRRHFNGVVTRFSQGGLDGRYHRYHAVVRPWPWFLTRTADCRILQEMTVPDILKKVLGEDPHADFALELTGSYRKWTYCVQYRETDFNFVSRLMEEEGIYYYFRHSDGHNTMVLTDSTSKHVPAPGCEMLPYFAPGQLATPDLDHVNSWDFAREIHSVAYVHTDYDFERPRVDLTTQKTLPRPTTPSVYEVFDYPGGYIQKPDGLQYAGVRMDEIGTQFEAARATTNARGLRTGCVLKLDRFPRADQNREYLVLSSTHDLEFSTYEGIAGGTSEYRCSFVAMSTAEQFRPARVTAKPFVQGPQTAVVVGPPGEEIYTDKYGRVKVQFHWDRLGKEDQDSSCWIRVSSPWAGKNWGGISTPRMGQEVIVDFLEGDPDQPIITGRVYNAEQMPPYELPANKTQSGVKSRSSLGGTPDNFNEIRFEDAKGKEHIVIHAERNLNIVVEANEQRTIGNNVSVTVGTNPKGDPKKNGLLTTTIFGDTSTTIQKGDLSLDVQTGKMTEHVKGPVEQKFDDTFKSTVASEIKLICGASSITLKKDGTIEISGKDIKINGTASVALDSAKIDSTAIGVQTIKGATVKINS